VTSAPLPMAQELAKLLSHPKKREWRVADGWSNLSKAFDRIPFDIFRASCEEHRIYSSRPVRLLKLNRSQGTNNGWLQWFQTHILITRSRIPGQNRTQGNIRGLARAMWIRWSARRQFGDVGFEAEKGSLFSEHDGTYVQYSTEQY
jgi:hypothetical protein